MNNSFQESRRSGIGGSDVAVILGVHPYKTIYELWDEKVNGNFKDLSSNISVLCGTLLESSLLEQYRILKMQTCHSDEFLLKNNKTFVNKDKPYLFANIDGLHLKNVGKSDEESCIVEIKTAGCANVDRWGPSGSAIIPQEYLCQISHYMMVCCVKKAVIAVTFLSESTKEKIATRVMKSRVEGRNSEIDFSDIVSQCETRTYDFERDPEFESIMLEACEKFWEHNVKKQIPPEKDYTSKGFQEMIKQRCSTIDTGTVMHINDPEIDIARNMYLELKEAVKLKTNELNSITAFLKELIGTNEKALFSDGSCFLRKVVKRKPYMVPESEYISFTYKGVKENG